MAPQVRLLASERFHCSEKFVRSDFLHYRLYQSVDGLSAVSLHHTGASVIFPAADDLDDVCADLRASPEMRLARTLKTNSQAEFGTAAPPIHRHTDYSGLMPASLTIGPHFAVSDASRAASSTGVEGVTGARIHAHAPCGRAVNAANRQEKRMSVVECDARRRHRRCRTKGRTSARPAGSSRTNSMSVHTTYNVSQVVGRAALRCAYGAPWKKSALGRGAPRRGAAGAGRGDRVQTVADDLSGSAASCCARYTIVEY